MEKVLVGRTNQVKIICPKCELEKNINVFKFKDTHKRLKVKCKCGEEFRLALDFRNYYRKNVRTDSTGSKEVNEHLSQQRADSVRQYL